MNDSCEAVLLVNQIHIVQMCSVIPKRMTLMSQLFSWIKYIKHNKCSLIAERMTLMILFFIIIESKAVQQV